MYIVFVFQVLFTLVLATEPVIHAVLQDTAIYPQKVYGYQILTMIALFLAWSGSIRLLFLERNKALPTIPTRGHGLVLLMLWTLALIKEHLPLISWWSNRYWWNIKGCVYLFISNYCNEFKKKIYFMKYRY